METPGSLKVGAEPLAGRVPLLFALFWLGFTTVHGLFMMRGLASEGGFLGWTMKLFLGAIYSLFFGVGFLMISGSLRWRWQVLRFGRPFLQGRFSPLPGQVVSLQLSDFKPLAETRSWQCALHAEQGTPDGDGGTDWKLLWQSPAQPLRWLPDVTGMSRRREASVAVPLPTPWPAALQAATQQGLGLRWTLRVMPAGAMDPVLPEAGGTQGRARAWRWLLLGTAWAFTLSDGAPAGSAAQLLSQGSVTPPDNGFGRTGQPDAGETALHAPARGRRLLGYVLWVGGAITLVQSLVIASLPSYLGIGFGLAQSWLGWHLLGRGRIGLWQLVAVVGVAMFGWHYLQPVWRALVGH